MLSVYQDNMGFPCALKPVHSHFHLGYLLQVCFSTPMMANFPFSAFPVWPARRDILPGRRVSWKQTESAPRLSPNESWYWPRPCWAALWRAGGTAWEFGQQTAEETEPRDSHHGRHQQPCSSLHLLKVGILER